MSNSILPPKIDAVFKRLMGDASDPRPLIGFLQAALTLPKEDYARLTFLDPQLPGDRPDDKLGILDVRVETTTHKQVNVEIQLVNLPEMPQRILFYLSRMIAGQIGRGEGYDVIKRTICILIADYVQFPETSAYHNTFTLYNPENGMCFTDLLEIHTLELPKLPAEGDDSPLYQWGCFFRAQTEEEMNMLANLNPAIGVAVGRLKELSQDERLRMLAESRQIAQWDEQSRLRGALNEGMQKGLQKGMQKGIQKGRQEGIYEVARNLLQLGLPVAQIETATGLSSAEILSLRDKSTPLH
jgi:predicted transposase/invertase (TIGR01784 family)